MSHLDPQGGRVLAHRLGVDLTDRLNLAVADGVPFMALDLTYDRGPYGGTLDPEGPELLWDTAFAEDHVFHFMRELGEFLGVDLKGKWICKREFQQGGWLHFHIIVLDVAWVPQKLVQDLWGHGFLWCRRGKPGRTALYLAKYQAKSGVDYPEWLYDRPAHSVKMISTSAGFWDRLWEARGGKKRPKASPQPPKAPGPVKPSPTVRDRINQSRRCVVLQDGKDRIDVEGIDIGSVLSTVFQKHSQLEYQGTKFGAEFFAGAVDMDALLVDLDHVKADWAQMLAESGWDDAINFYERFSTNEEYWEWCAEQDKKATDAATASSGADGAAQPLPLSSYQDRFLNTPFDVFGFDDEEERQAIQWVEKHPINKKFGARPEDLDGCPF